MGKWVHVLTDIDLASRSGVCAHCGPVKIILNNHRTKKAVCPTAYSGNKKRRATARGAMQDYLSVCERCDFIPESPNQIEVHHVDRNPHNNEMINLMALCANCHRFVHYHN